jgi:hypothetical protein
VFVYRHKAPIRQLPLPKASIAEKVQQVSKGVNQISKVTANWDLWMQWTIDKGDFATVDVLEGKW